VLVGRRNCGLCEELAGNLSRLGVSFETVDIDADEDLLFRFDDAVPVLLLDGQELARAPFSERSLREVVTLVQEDAASRR
jgi:hypothetical protein